MQPELVTLLMPAYNNIKYIYQAIESAIEQTYPHWELLIQIDGADDGTCELAMGVALKEPRVKIQVNEKRLGLNLTRVAIQKRITGAYVAHFDSDDLLERYAIEETLKVFKANPELMLVYSDMAHIEPEGGINNYKIISYSASKDFDPSKLYNYGWRHFGMYKSKVLQDVYGYNDKLSVVPGCSDGDLFMQIAEKFPVKRLPKVLYFYRNHATNNSKKKPKCQECPANPNCNYIRVWSSSLGVNQQTLLRDKGEKHAP